MVPGFSHRLTPEQHRILLQNARRSILHGLEQGGSLPITLSHYSESLQAIGASFVTLHITGRLRGCIGTLEAARPLIEDVVHHAHAAAFSDSRFRPLSRVEFDAVHIEISVLSPPEPMQYTSEADLVRQIRPKVDGLILEEGVYRGTFLPGVWDSLPEPRDFLWQLKHKAGLPSDYWSDTLNVQRYTTESFAE